MESQDYEKHFDDFVSLVDKQLAIYESASADLGNLARTLPALISLVNTIGYLRGQDGMFLDFRPRTDNQKHFYATEHEYEKRLNSLISKVLESKHADYYKKRLHSYFCQVRTLEKGTVL